MSSNKPIISICIPTYNREKLLKRCIEAIIVQEAFKVGMVNIVITDNASTDDTAIMVKSYQDNYSYIQYHRNDENYGMTANLLKAFENGNGEYLWLFGSDDIMTSEALKVTLNVIKNEQPGLIFSDRHVFSDLNIDGNPPLHTGKKDIVFDGINSFVSFLGLDNKKNGRMNGNFFTFISIVCVKKDIYYRNKAQFIEKYGNTYHHLTDNYFNYIMIPMFNLINEKIAIVKSTILVLAQGGNHGWSFDGMYIFKDLFFSLNVFRRNYKLTLRCRMFFVHMLLGWFVASVSGVMRKKRIFNGLRKPLSYLIRPFI